MRPPWGWGGRGSSDRDLDGSPALPQLHRCARVPSRPRRLVRSGCRDFVGVDLLVDLGVGVDVDFDRNGDVDWDDLLLTSAHFVRNC